MHWKKNPSNRAVLLNKPSAIVALLWTHVDIYTHSSRLDAFSSDTCYETWGKKLQMFQREQDPSWLVGEAFPSNLFVVAILISSPDTHATEVQMKMSEWMVLPVGKKAPF